MNSSTTKRPHVVILGGGFGGLSAVRALKHADVHVTLIDRTNHHVFQPLLYQAATAALETTDIAFPYRSLLRRHKNTEVLMAEAEGVDLAACKVQLPNGESVVYDYLIFAVGARSSYFGHPEYQRYSPSLKSVQDAIQIRYRVLVAFEKAEQEPDPEAQRALLTFVVVGGGPTGVELAGAIGELGQHALKRDFRHIDPTQAKVILVEAGPNILPTYPASLQAAAVRQLVSLGVEVRCSAMVRAVDESGLVVGSERVAARTVLWGAGVAGTPLARTLGVPLDRRGAIHVTSELNPPGFPNVFVIGDAAALLQNGEPVPGVAPAAIQEGHYAARAILKRIQGKPLEPFHYWNKGTLATIGRRRAVAFLPGGVKLSGILAWICYLGIHLIYLSGFKTRVRVFFSWVWSYLTWTRGARLIPTVIPPELSQTGAVDAQLAKPPSEKIEEPPRAPPPH